MEIPTIETFVPYWQRIRKRTLRVASRIPRDEMEWRPGEERFSFGDLLRHLAAIERYMFTENAHRRPSRYPGHGPELAHGRDGIFAYVDRMHGESVDLLGQLTPDDLLASCTTPAGTPITVWKWLRAMVEHEAHHRGQIYHMLGTLGVETPPLYGLTEEEVKARSRPLDG